MSSNIPTLSVKKPHSTTSKLVRPSTVQRSYLPKISASVSTKPTLTGIKRPSNNVTQNAYSVSKFKRTTPLSLMRQNNKIPKTTAKNSTVTRLDFTENSKISMTNTKTFVPSSRISSVSSFANITIDNVEKPTFETKATSPIVDWNSLNKDSEIISFKVKISVLEKQVEELNFKNSKIRIENEINETKMRNEIDDKIATINEMKDELRLIKEQKTELKSEFETLKDSNLEQNNDLENQRLDYENIINKLKLELNDTKSEKENIRSKLSSDAILFQHRINELENELRKTKNEIEVYNLNSKEFKLKEDEMAALRSELHDAKIQIKHLNDEIESYQEGSKLQDILKVEISELKKVQDENNHLKNQVDLLKGVNEDNLILNEKILGFQSEIENLKSIINEKNVNLAELNQAKNRIAEWIEIIGFDSPDIVANQILELRQNAALLRVENDSLKSQINLTKENNSYSDLSSKSIEIELLDAKKKVDQLTDSLKKLNRKCLLFSKEKESYKKIINSYESEITINTDSLIQNRIADLESIIEEYKAILVQQEEDLKSAQENLLTNISKDKEIQQLQNELKHIKTLNPHIYTNISLNESSLQTNEKNYRVIHLKDNPMSQKIDEYIEQHEKMQEEISRLKILVELLESGNVADMTRQIDEGIQHQLEVEKLKKTLKSQENKQNNLIDSFKRTSKAFRETCLFLTGFRIDNFNKNRYRLIHEYDTSEELVFEINNKSIQLLENSATSKLQDIIHTYLNEHDSYPAFLAAYTLRLFNTRTIV